MDIQDVIQAFADGEPVDPVELDQALADPEGRAHLIDIVVLRKLVRRSHVAAPVDGRRADLQVRRPLLRSIAAAAVIAIGASVGGYVIGERTMALRTPVTQAPTGASETARSGGPDRLRQGSGESAVASAEAEGPPYDQATAPAPAPTVVIRFRPGVDWTESGGH